jgi:hypothetical protein
VHRLAPALRREAVTRARVKLLLGEQLLVRALPLLLGNDLGEIHATSLVVSI